MASPRRILLAASLLASAAASSGCGFTYEPDPGRVDTPQAGLDAAVEFDFGAQPFNDLGTDFDAGPDRDAGLDFDAMPHEPDQSMATPCEPEDDAGADGGWEDAPDGGRGDGGWGDGGALPDAELDPCAPVADAGAPDMGDDAEAPDP